jgi:hypothetical protein
MYLRCMLRYVSLKVKRFGAEGRYVSLSFIECLKPWDCLRS